MSLAAVSPVSSQSSNQSTGSQQPSSAGAPSGSGAETFDYKKAFESQRHETQTSIEALRNELERERSGRQKDSEVLGKIRDVFQPPQQGEADPTVEWEQMLDYYIAEGVKAKERGQPMPLTINNGIMTYKSMIENYRKEQAMKQEIEQLKSQLNELRDPQQHINREAYSTLDSVIKRGLDNLYGPGSQMMEQKRSMFHAVGQQVAAVVDQMAKKEPHKWDMVRRDPEALSEIAQRVLRANIPPKALQLIAEDNLKNTEMPLSELRQAFREADSIQDPRERQQVKTQIRQEILERMWRSGKVRVRE